jgi:methyl-accepting chemotaxis protein
MKMPDFSELKKKVNIQSMVDNVKSAIDTVSTPKAPATSDELTTKFAEITELMNSLADMNAQQAKAVANIKAKIHALDKDIQTVKGLATQTAHSPNSDATTHNVVEQAKVKAAKNIHANAQKPNNQQEATVEEQSKNDQ